MELRDNTQLEVLPGDNIIVRYEDPRTATPKRNRHEQRLNVAFNDAVVSASFLNYIDTEEGRELVLEPIRRFRYDDAVAIVIEDPDMDASPEKDIIEIKVTSSSGGNAVIKAVETEEQSGRVPRPHFPGQRRAGPRLGNQGHGRRIPHRHLPRRRKPQPRHPHRAHRRHPARPLHPILRSPPTPVTTKPLPAPEKRSAERPPPALRTEVVPPRRILISNTPTHKITRRRPGFQRALRCGRAPPRLAGSSTMNAYVQTEPDAKRNKPLSSSPSTSPHPEPSSSPAL
jgi:hypothetical protein